MTSPTPNTAPAAAHGRASARPAGSASGVGRVVCSRRRMLLGTAATAAGALLAACAPKETVERVAAADVPLGSGLVVGEYVVTHPAEGKYHAFSSRCPHQGGRISQFADGAMVCPDHDSHFDLSTGEVISGPSRNPASPAPLAAEGGDTLVVGSGG
ncbi:Rieske (2Fe-2S) protein [Corynebacterium sp. 335C]